MNEERKERIKAAQAKIIALSVTEREQLAAKYGIITIEGRPLSVYNQCFLISQRDNTTVVGGYKQWLKAGRQVLKGQHGMSIYIPTGNKDTEGKVTDEDPQFWFATVFDISQTEPVEVEKEQEVIHEVYS